MILMPGSEGGVGQACVFPGTESHPFPHSKSPGEPRKYLASLSYKTGK